MVSDGCKLTYSTYDKFEETKKQKQNNNNNKTKTTTTKKMVLSCTMGMELAKQNIRKNLCIWRAYEDRKFKRKWKLLTWWLIFFSCRALEPCEDSLRPVYAVLSRQHACRCMLTCILTYAQTSPPRSPPAHSSVLQEYFLPAAHQLFFECFYYMLVYLAHSLSECRLSEGECVCVCF